MKCLSKNSCVMLTVKQIINIKHLSWFYVKKKLVVHIKKYAILLLFKTFYNIGPFN